jgi:ribosomal-protein-alanine acetyltransferase
MKGRIEIRRFRLADMDRVLRIERSSFGEDAYDRNLFAEFYHTCGGLFLVAVRRSDVCGYMVTCTRGERGEVVSIAVDPASRGRGAASALMNSTLRRLRRRRVQRLALMVKTSNEPARAFYEKCHFKKLRLARGYYEDGTDGVLMALKL